jgi:DNA-binding response OmpR family regulator
MPLTTHPPDGEGPPTAFRVLIVNDDRETADSEGLLLGQQGYECRTAHDGRAAVAQAAAFRPHAILLDVGLKPDGFTVAGAIRRQSQVPRPFLVAIAAVADEKHQSRSLLAGFDYYLVKPLDPELLLRLLATLRAKVEGNRP